MTTRPLATESIPGRPPRSRDAWLLLASILVAFGLRVYRLPAQSLWYDEAVTAQVAAKGVVELARWTADDIQPPLYYYLVSGWTHLAGRGEWALRFPSVFFGTLLVPLLWAIARRIFGSGAVGRIAALLAGLLAAVSPPYVYYAQEARMYTQLIFLGALAGYALLAAVRGGRRARWWPALSVVAAAVLYTHYFGIFLLAAYGLCLLLDRLPALARSDRAAWGVVGRAALAGLAAGLLYLPWLPAMLARYRMDRSYWQGSLKLGEAVRHVAISFVAGAPEVMLEQNAVHLLPWFTLAAALAVGVLAARNTPARRALAGLTIVLAVPVIGVLVLASRSPKFNARYLLLVSPAYLLILASGTATLLAGRGRVRLPALRLPARAAAVAAGLALIALPLAVSAVAVHNWFTDPAFTKAQWREVAAYVRQQIGPEETVLLVSGHAAPAWDYYAADIPPTRLPDIDILDVDAVLGFDAGLPLDRALRGKTGVWVVLWQSSAVDPAGMVPFYLDRAGDEIPVARQFWQLKLRHWRLDPAASYPAEPQPQHDQGANFAHQVALLGWDDPRAGQITVYWQALGIMERDYQVSLVLEDAAGHEVAKGGDVRPVGYNYPTFRWRPGQALAGRYTLPVPADLPTGSYYLSLGLYDAVDPSGLDIMDVADNPAGKRVRLGPIHLPAGLEK